MKRGLLVKIDVVYGSQYGHAKRYALMIEADRASRGDVVEVYEAGRYIVDSASEPDTLVFVSSNYGGTLTRVSTLVDAARSYSRARLILLSVGMGSAARVQDNQKLWDRNIPADVRSRIECFHARGGIDYGRLTVKHRAMMTAVRGFIAARPAAKRHPEDQQMLDTFGTGADYVSSAQLEPLLEALARREDDRDLA